MHVYSFPVREPSVELMLGERKGKRKGKGKKG
jgi:hypothetical protein